MNKDFITFLKNVFICLIIYLSNKRDKRFIYLYFYMKKINTIQTDQHLNRLILGCEKESLTKQSFLSMYELIRY